MFTKPLTLISIYNVVASKNEKIVKKTTTINYTPKNILFFTIAPVSLTYNYL